MDDTRKFNANITTRYDKAHEQVYKDVLSLVEKEGLSRSRAQLLLVERGLQHTQNPEPLIKEKVIYKDRVVYTNRPQREHLSSDEESKRPSTQRSLTLKSDIPKDSSNIAGWIGGGILVSVVVGGLIYRWLIR